LSCSSCMRSDIRRLLPQTNRMVQRKWTWDVWPGQARFDKYGGRRDVHLILLPRKLGSVPSVPVRCARHAFGESVQDVNTGRRKARTALTRVPSAAMFMLM